MGMKTTTNTATGYWTVHSLYVDSAVAECDSLASAKAEVSRRGFSAVIRYEGSPLMYWCPISGWSRARS
jgi:hypothetical protein